MNESEWMSGNKAAWRAMLHECLRNLTDAARPDATLTASRLTLETQETREALKELWEEMSVPEEWSDDLYLPDVVRTILERIA